MENVSKQIMSMGGMPALDFGLTNGKSNGAYESASPSSSSDPDQNGDIGGNSYLERSGLSGDYSSEKLTPPFTDDENGDSEGPESNNNLNEDTLAFSGLDIEVSRLATPENNYSVDVDTSLDMFAPTPARLKVNGVSFNEEVLVPATQPGDVSTEVYDGNSTVVEDSRFDETSRVSENVSKSELESPAPEENRTSELDDMGHSDTCFDVIVPATQQAEAQSFDSEQPSTIECSDADNTIPSFVGSNTSTDDPKKEFYNSTFAVSPTPMKLTSRPFIKKKEKGLKDISEDNATYVMDISAQIAPRGNLTYPKVLPKSSSNSFTAASGPIQHPTVSTDGPNRGMENITTVSEAVPASLISSAIETGEKESLLESNNNESSLSKSRAGEIPQEVYASVDDQPSSLVNDEVTPHGALNLEQDVALGVDSKQQSIEGVKPATAYFDSSPEQSVPVVNSTPAFFDPPVPVPLSVSVVITPEASAEAGQPETCKHDCSIKRLIPPLTVSPRKGKKLYAEPTPPIIKTLPPTKVTKSYSSSSESEEESSAAAASSKNGAAPARFKCYSKRGRDSKADREALFEIENPRATTSAALVRHNARGRKASPKPKEQPKKVLKKRVLVSKEVKGPPEEKKPKVVREKRKGRPRKPQDLQSKENKASDGKPAETDDEATSANLPPPVPNSAQELRIEVSSLGIEIGEGVKEIKKDTRDHEVQIGSTESEIVVRGENITDPEDRLVKSDVMDATVSAKAADPKSQVAQKLFSANCSTQNPEVIPASEVAIDKTDEVGPSTKEARVPEDSNQESMPVLENQSLEAILEEMDEMPLLHRVTRNRRQQANRQMEIAQAESKPAGKRTRARASADPEVITEPKSETKTRRTKPMPNSSSATNKLKSEAVIILKAISIPSKPASPAQHNSVQNQITTDVLNVNQPLSQASMAAVRVSPRKGRRMVLDTITLDSDTEDHEPEASESDYENEEKGSNKIRKKAKVEDIKTPKASFKKVPTAGNRSPAFQPPPTPMKKGRSKLAIEAKEPVRKRGRQAAVETVVPPAEKPTTHEKKRKTTKKLEPPKTQENEDSVRRSGRQRKPRKYDDGFFPYCN